MLEKVHNMILHWPKQQLSHPGSSYGGSGEMEDGHSAHSTEMVEHTVNKYIL